MNCFRVEPEIPKVGKKSRVSFKIYSTLGNHIGGLYYYEADEASPAGYYFFHENTIHSLGPENLLLIIGAVQEANAALKAGLL